MHTKTFFIALIIAVSLSGCSWVESIDLRPSPKANTVPYQENALNSLVLGRQYQAEGRFELARETFLHGLATARNEQMQSLLAEEIEATDRLIASNR